MIRTELEARNYVASLTDERGFERLERYAGLLVEENGRQNLISKASEARLWQRHFADSAQLLEHVSRETISDDGVVWLDLGTGAGLPGLIISILRPQLQVKLVESRQRRANFLDISAKALGLTNCTVLCDRLERIDPFPARVISARAFAPLDKLLRLSAPFSTKATTFLLPKGRSAAHELAEQKLSIRAMFHVEQSLTDDDAGIIVSSSNRD